MTEVPEFDRDGRVVARKPANGSTAAASAWPDVTPLDAPSAPPFPVDALPTPLRDFAVELSEATQTPVDMAAMFELGAVAAVCGGRVWIEPKPGWREGCNLFVAVAMELQRSPEVIRHCS